MIIANIKLNYEMKTRTGMRLRSWLFTNQIKDESRFLHFFTQLSTLIFNKENLLLSTQYSQIIQFKPM